MRSSCAGVALSPARMAAGSPGVSRSSRNTNSATTPITGTAASTRRSRYPSIPVSQSCRRECGGFCMSLAIHIFTEFAGFIDASDGAKPVPSNGLAGRHVLADRERADTRQMHVGQAGFLGPGVELRLHLGEIALGFDLRRNIQPGVAQAGDHVLRRDEPVPADKAQEHLPGVAAE